jgi:transcription initiation factor TFIIIB Brf1 subunit/transcription initiation factor TFIIB
MNNKNNFITQNSDQCKICKNQNITDSITGEIFCPKCGNVEKTFGNNSSQEKILSEITTPKSQYHKHNREGGEKGFRLKDSRGIKLIGKNKLWYNKITSRSQHWKTNLEKYQDIKRNKTFECMETILSKRKIPEHAQIFDEGCMLYDKFVKNDISYRKNHKTLASVCVYFACKNYNYDITIEEISNDINEDSKIIKQNLKNIVKLCHHKNVKTKNDGKDKLRLIKLELLKFPTEIISEKIKRNIVLDFDFEKIERVIASSKKESVASGIIDITSRENKLSVNVKKIAEIYHVSEHTVRSQSKNIQKELKK